MYALGANAKKNPFLGFSKSSMIQPSNLNPQQYVPLFIKNKLDVFVNSDGLTTTVLKSSPKIETFDGTVIGASSI